jgi:hypothetical protein
MDDRSRFSFCIWLENKCSFEHVQLCWYTPQLFKLYRGNRILFVRITSFILRDVKNYIKDYNFINLYVILKFILKVRKKNLIFKKRIDTLKMVGADSVVQKGVYYRMWF